MPKAHRPRHVGILVETDDSWGRNVVDAVCRFAQSNGWTVLIAPRDSQGRLRLPKVWKGDGIIASLRTTSSVQHVKNWRLPVVDVGIMVPKYDWLARVATDDTARGKMAFEHLRDRGLTHFACYAPPIGRYSDIRSEAFAAAVHAGGHECAMYEATPDDAAGWLTNYSNVRRWLATLPRPLGIFAADPYPARQLIEICSFDSIRIPDEVAVLSGDDDELLCNVASPQISAVELASHRLGETAAGMLARIMNGSPVPKRPKLIAPLRVRERHSTDILAMADDEIAEILRFIRDRASMGITVSDLLRAFPISRRRLEQRFRAELDRSPAEEIRRVRMAYVSRLLLDSDKAVSAVAAEAGFSTGASLSQAFRQHFGTTPGEYRKQNRAT
ncbi:XylR family transcriptional regulator [Rhodopirellula sp. JC740]|uniref:XylR family transcriptional regulator n=1 Tax=Rhodopirellula halodulae TaxID=2894198 RepID=A0ABS8NFX0_9BACT|nr:MULTISPECIES: XylR family transcriptional regulator [unclassified Rhodopirellula]MCC9642428.1 XylR family transcriptional regulator [Rhodopirellula sp. JC740]MCC9654501.1 XylR family transcriptional regulator [Rhodopirellula sp. JC737]